MGRKGDRREGWQEGLQVIGLCGPSQLPLLFCNQVQAQLLASTSSSHSMLKYIFIFFFPKESGSTNLPSLLTSLPSSCSPDVETRYLLAVSVRESQASSNRCYPHQGWTPSRCQHTICLRPMFLISSYLCRCCQSSQQNRSNPDEALVSSGCSVKLARMCTIRRLSWYLMKLEWHRQTMLA